ncbi:MAG: UDP-N-acetylglucosamine 2-epimerase, partial [Bacteroidota bacterium]
DIASEVKKSPALNFDPYEKYGGVGALPDYRSGYLVVMQHPVTTEYQASRAHVEETLHAIHQLGIPTFWFWSNVDAGSDGTSNGIRAFRESHNIEHIHFFKNMEPNDFLRLLINSQCLIGNSSVGIRECSFLGVPVVNIGVRQNGRERGPNVKDVSYSREEIKAAVRSQIEHPAYPGSNIYGDGTAGGQIADILATRPLTFSKRLTY